MMINFLIAIFATWRISAMLSYESGAFDMFIKMRERIGIIHDNTGQVIDSNGSFLAELFSCIWCLSIWVAFMAGLIVYFYPVLVFIFYPFAISAGAILVERIIRT